MTKETISILIACGIFLLPATLFLLYVLFKSKYKHKKQREPFECPFDSKSCYYVNTADMRMDMNCSNCKRYKP